MKRDPTPATRLVLVTGPSGAGRSTALNALEDLGFETIDNLPLRLWPRLLDTPPDGPPDGPLALVIDTRNRDFSVDALKGEIARLRAMPGLEVTLLYLDCRDDVLLRRFSETRRPHPLAPAGNPETGIGRELDLLAPVRDRADMLMDTSDLNVHQLRGQIEDWFAPGGARPLAISVLSFSYKRGLPRNADMVFDCRFLANPYWVERLRDLDGRSAEVQAHVAGDPRFAAFLDRVVDLTRMLLPAFVEEGKSHVAIAFGCTGGRHRSVTLAETVAGALADEGKAVSVRHRELDDAKNG